MSKIDYPYNAKNKLLDVLDLLGSVSHILHQLFRPIWALIILETPVGSTQDRHPE